MSRAPDASGYPGRPVQPAALPGRRVRALPAAGSMPSAPGPDGGIPASDASDVGGPVGEYPATDATAAMSTPPQDSWFTPRTAGQSPQGQVQGQGQAPEQGPSRGQGGIQDFRRQGLPSEYPPGDGSYGSPPQIGYGGPAGYGTPNAYGTPSEYGTPN